LWRRRAIRETWALVRIPASCIGTHACCLPIQACDKHSVRGGKTEMVEIMGDLRSDNGDALRAWSVAGMGLSLRETLHAAEELRSGALVRVQPEWAEPATPIQAVHVQRDPVPYRIGAFVEFLAEQWREAPWDAGQ